MLTNNNIGSAYICSDTIGMNYVECIKKLKT
jgi:hypothetical protein